MGNQRPTQLEAQLPVVGGEWIETGCGWPRATCGDVGHGSDGLGLPVWVVGEAIEAVGCVRRVAIRAAAVIRHGVGWSPM